MNVEKIAEYRASRDAAEGITVAEGLRAAFLALVASGDMSEEDYLFACAQGLDEIRERVGSDPRPHTRKAERMLNGLVIANDRLVEKITRRTLGSRSRVEANLDEACNEGRLGLVRAIEEFNPERGAFSTCAGFWIRYYVQTCMQKQVDFAKQRPACMPASVARLANKFRLNNGREPEAADLGVEPAKWARWLDQAVTVSVEDMTSRSEDGSQGGSDDLIADERTNPEAVIASFHFQEKLAKVMAAMSPRQRDLTRALFIDGRSFPDVGEEFGICAQRVHQIKNDLEKRLRELLAA